jgi:HAD superfamily phosphoserine phosphatase-like hydrolase
MPAPRIFISSTYVDLVDVRSVVESHFKELLYDPVVFERGGIHFDPRKPLDLSCYNAVKECDMMVLIIGGRYGSNSSDTFASSDGRSLNSVTKTEYLEALSAGIPILTFVRQKVHNEYYSYANQPKAKRKDFRPSTVDNILVFQLIKEIHELGTNNLLIEYETAAELLNYLKKSTASLVQDALKNRRSGDELTDVLINGYKLFYFRRQSGLSHKALSKATCLQRNFLTSLENVRSSAAADKHGSIFRTCPSSVITRIESALGCPGQLTAGREDDLLSMYIQYYHCNRGKPPVDTSGSNQFESPQLFPVRCVVFDFDGTLTRQNDRTTWELIWEELKYTVEDCAKLHRDFTNRTITHTQWCERACEAFVSRELSEKTLSVVASRIQLMPGVKEVLELFLQHKIEVHILSGSIDQIIQGVLGSLANYFTNIQANSFKFTGGVLSYIQGTNFDFEGKATYVTQLMQRKNYAPTDVLFVGNSSNDRWVSRSGVTTLCVNPHFTDGTDSKEWLHCIREMRDLREILKFIRLQTAVSPNDT